MFFACVVHVCMGVLRACRGTVKSVGVWRAVGAQ